MIWKLLGRQHKEIYDTAKVFSEVETVSPIHNEVTVRMPVTLNSKKRRQLNNITDQHPPYMHLCKRPTRQQTCRGTVQCYKIL